MNYSVTMNNKHFVLDLDCKNSKNGKNNLNLLEMCNCDLPNTFRVGTPSDSYHVYLTDRAANSVSRKELSSSIDVRSKSSYVLKPSSMIDSKAYELLTIVRLQKRPHSCLN